MFKRGILKMDQFWRDKIIHRLFTIKQKLDRKCHLDYSELEILKLLVDIKLEVLNLNAFPDLLTQMDFKLEQILKQEMSNLKLNEDEDIEEVKQLLKVIPPKFDTQWPSNQINIEDTD